MPVGNYHIVLTDGTERNVRAGECEISESGALILSVRNEGLTVAYQAGAWIMVEREIKDDRDED